tara:strand:+ start:2279 stop:2419 length:141 start_codon:yes stop_codon:yes gene_type:complete
MNQILCQGDGFKNIEVNNYINSEYDIRDLEKTYHLIEYWESYVEKL